LHESCLGSVKGPGVPVLTHLATCIVFATTAVLTSVQPLLLAALAVVVSFALYARLGIRSSGQISTNELNEGSLTLSARCPSQAQLTVIVDLQMSPTPVVRRRRSSCRTVRRPACRTVVRRPPCRRPPCRTVVRRPSAFNRRLLTASRPSSGRLTCSPSLGL
jgi:hypothetical protein